MAQQQTRLSRVMSSFPDETQAIMNLLYSRGILELGQTRPHGLDCTT